MAGAEDGAQRVAAGQPPGPQPLLGVQGEGLEVEEGVWIGRHWRKGLGQAALRVVWGWSQYLIPHFFPAPHPHTCPSSAAKRFQPYVLYCLLR